MPSSHEAGDIQVADKHVTLEDAKQTQGMIGHNNNRKSSPSGVGLGVTPVRLGVFARGRIPR